MRVVHVYKDVYPPIVGGIERHIDTIRRAMPPDVESVLVACSRQLRTRTRKTEHGTEVLVGELGRVLSTPLAPSFPSWLARQGADVVHLHMPNPTGEISALLTLKNTPLIVSFHAEVDRQAVLNPLYRPLVHACMRRATSILVTSRRMLANSPTLAPWREKVQIVPYGIDLDRFDSARVSPEERQRVREQFGSPMIVSTGRLVYYKGFEHLIAASRELEASVVIIGSGPLEARLRSLSRDLPRVHLLGEVPEDRLLACLSAADCFVLASTSHAEGFGIATLEAQALGLPAVVTDVGTATVEAIQPDVSGLVVSPGSVPELTAACKTLLEQSSRRAAMRTAAREHVQRHHSSGALGAKLREIYAAAMRGTPTDSMGPKPE